MPVCVCVFLCACVCVCVHGHACMLCVLVCEISVLKGCAILYFTAKEVERGKERDREEETDRERGDRDSGRGVSFFPLQHAVGLCFWLLSGSLHLLLQKGKKDHKDKKLKILQKSSDVCTDLKSA